MSIIQLAGNIEDMQEYEALPDGLYVAECLGAEVKYSEKLPNGYVSVSLKIHPDQFPPDYDEGNAPEGVNVTYARAAIPDGSNRKQVKPFRALVKAFTGSEAVGATFDPAEWVGREVQVVLKRAEYAGADVNNVDGIRQVPKV